MQRSQIFAKNRVFCQCLRHLNVLDLSVRPSVRPFVCYQLVNVLRQRIKRFQGINLPLGNGMKGRPQELGGKSSRSQEAAVMFGSLTETAV